MGRWTHVMGVIRFDGIRDIIPRPELGKMLSYSDLESGKRGCDVPLGSEGSLSHHLITNPDESCLAKWVATIWGDLKDYNNSDEIIEYFNRITKDRMIRSGMFMIKVEGEANRVFVNKDNKWEEIKENYESNISY